MKDDDEAKDGNEDEPEQTAEVQDKEKSQILPEEDPIPD